MSNLIKEYLIYKENKSIYTNEELDVIENSILEKCKRNLKKISNTFIESIDNIND